MDIKLGDTFSTKREITDELIRTFAELSGDRNPIHLDEEFAAKTRFGRRIATATVRNIREDKRIVTLDTICSNQTGEITLKGEAVVMILP